MDSAGEPRVGSIFAGNMIEAVEARNAGCAGFRCQLSMGGESPLQNVENSSGRSLLKTSRHSLALRGKFSRYQFSVLSREYLVVSSSL